MTDFHAHKDILSGTFLHPVYRYHKLLKLFFSQFYYELVSKYKVGLKYILQQGLSEAELYGDLVYKLRKIVNRADFSDKFREVTMRYKRFEYDINVKRQSAVFLL